MKLLKSAALAALLLCTPSFVPASSAAECRLMEDEMAEAAAHQFAPIRDYQGAEGKAFVATINKIATQPIDADQARVFANPEFAQVMVVFFKGGCFVMRVPVPVLLYKQIDADTKRALEVS